MGNKAINRPRDHFSAQSVSFQVPSFELFSSLNDALINLVVSFVDLAYKTKKRKRII